MLSVDITHRFKDFTLDVSFAAPEGITVLFGRSGSGKTSVINAVAGLFDPDGGRIETSSTVHYDKQLGIRVPSHKRRIGYVFQEARLFPHLSVRQNLLYGRRFAPRTAAQKRPGFEEGRITELLGIGGLLERRPRDLSGGERQRVAIGRALLADPEMLLADEPLASLDAARKEEIIPFFERLRDDLQVPMLYVSHSASEVARLATTVVVLENGRVVRQGSAAEVLSDPDIAPLGPRDAGAVLQARVLRHHDDGLTELDAGGHALFLPEVAYRPGSDLRIRIAAQDVMLSRTRPVGLSALNILPGRIERMRDGTGPGVMVVLDTRAGRLLARVTRRSANALELAPGVEVYAIVKTVSVAPGDVGVPAG